MALGGIGASGPLSHGITDLKARLDALQTQLATGRKAETYGGLGQTRSLALGLRSEIGQINSYQATIQTVSLRLSVADSALQRIQGISDESRNALLITPYSVGSDGRALAQISAEATLNELVSLLNGQVSGHHLFAGRSADSPPVVAETLILDGEVGRAGFRQVLDERRIADLGGDLQALTSVIGTGAIASTADAFATIASGAIAADADVQATGTAIGTGSAQVLNAGAPSIADGDQLLIEVDSTTYTVDFSNAAVGHNIAGNTLTFDLDGGGINTVADLQGQLDTLLGAAVSVTETGGALDFTANAATENIRFTDSVGTNVADLNLNGVGYGVDGTDRLTSRNSGIQELAFGGETLQVDFGGVTVGTVQFGTGANVSNLAELVAILDGYVGVSAAEAGGIITLSTTDTNDADSDIVLTGTDNNALETVLNFAPDAALGSVATALPTNLLSPVNGLTQGDTLSIKVGTQTTNITFGVNVGEISSLDELNTRLNAITAGAVSVVTTGSGTGNISATAGNVGESITISGSFNTAASFGLTEGVFSEALTSIVGAGATASTADAVATIASAAIGADADISQTGTQIGTGSAQALNGILTDGNIIDIEINGTTYSVNFDAAHVGHGVVGNTLNFDLNDAANTVADLDDQITTLLAGTGVTVTEASGQLTFAGDATVEYVRFADNSGVPVANLGLGGAGYGTGTTDRLATRNATLDQLAFEGATLQVDFGGATVGTVQFGTGANVSNLSELVATIDGYAGVSASQTAGVLTVATTNPTDADSTIALTGDSNSTLETVLGYTPDVAFGSVVTATPTNLLSPANGLTQGDTLSLQVGSQTTNITFGVNVGEVSTLAELNTILAAISPGSAAVVTAGSSTGNISISTGSANDSITVSGSLGTAARFGLSEGVVSDLVLGRLVVPTAVGTTVAISEDVDGHPFGFKLNSVSSDLSGTVVTGPVGTPTSIQVTFTATLPAAGEAIAIGVDLPDGSKTEIRLTATASVPPGKGEFSIGIDDLSTTSNFETALRVETSRIARTALASASAIEASTNFFDFDSGNPPQRVGGPPFASATGLVDATAADTVFWYQGDLGLSGRDSAVARVDSSLTVAYGARADEAALRDVFKYVALLAAEKFDASTTTDELRYTELKDRLIPRLAGAGGQPQVTDIAIELAQKNVIITAAKARHNETLVFTAGTLDTLEGANIEEVATQILHLQIQLQASFETTSIMARLSILYFL